MIVAKLTSPWDEARVHSMHSTPDISGMRSENR